MYIIVGATTFRLFPMIPARSSMFPKATQRLGTQDVWDDEEDMCYWACTFGG
jgi:hypothetical protein